MIKYIAIANFTANINGNHKQFITGEVFTSPSPVPELDRYCTDSTSLYEVANDKIVLKDKKYPLHGLAVKVEEKEEITSKKNVETKK